MKKDTQALSENVFDVLIVGGGIFAACAAWDACLRGFSVALIEKDDFCSGTSANSFKFIHGGIRYLQHADIKRLRSSCKERSAFLKIAPHLVSPMPVLIPTYGYGKSGKAFLGTGMYLYDLLTIDRNRKIRDPNRIIPWSRFISRNEVLKDYPDIKADGLTGGAVFYDGQIYNPTRLVLSFIKSASDHGAIVANYTEAQEFLRSGNTITGVRALDHESGDTMEIRARVTLNASGPWSEKLLNKSSISEDSEKIVYSRDTCFVVPKKLSGKYAIAIQGQTYDPDALLSRPARHLFLVPWRNYTLVGVWHVIQDNPDNITVEKNEIQSFIDEMNWAYPSLNLKTSDVTIWNAGLVPFGENEPGQENLSYGKQSHLIDHTKSDKLDNLVTLIGIRITMARGDAEKAIDLIAAKLGKKGLRSSTEFKPVAGGDIADFENLVAQASSKHKGNLDPTTMRALIHNHGTGYENILAYKDELGTLGKTSTLRAEVHHAIEYEMVAKLSDIVFRRTDLGTGGHPGDEVIRECADILALNKGWSPERMQKEIDEVNARFPDFG
jgi:glycerol-3-phosphate dehydrogenase